MKKFVINIFVTLPITLNLCACGADKKIDSVDIKKDELLSEYVDVNEGFSAILADTGDVLYESVAITEGMRFDKIKSLKAFGETLYPHLRGLPNTSPSGALKPLHSSENMALAHEYALTQVYFNNPSQSKLVTDLSIYRRNCPTVCSEDATAMTEEIVKWKEKILSMIYQAPRGLAESSKVSDEEIEAYINTDRLNFSEGEGEYMVYTSHHKLHNSGATADELNIARVAVSKALNSVARWAPKIVNPTDVLGNGILYRFDIRDYWGWNKGITKLLFGGSDDDIAFSQNKRNYLGDLIGEESESRYQFTDTVEADASLATLIWQRVLHGEVEGAQTIGNVVPFLDGFHAERINQNSAGKYIAAKDLHWVDSTQLVYTLTRPDVYSSIMMIPMHADQLEDELGVDKSLGIDSYDYFVTFDALTIDAQFAFKAERDSGGFYWKTFEVFTGQLSGGDRSIYDVYKEEGDDIRFPFWANPIPKFVSPDKVEDDLAGSLSFIATLAQTGPSTGFAPDNSLGCDEQPGTGSFGFCRHYTGAGGAQQAGSTIIWDLPNGLNGYMRTGAFNQRRLSAFTNVIRDPALTPNAADNVATQTGFNYDKLNGESGSSVDPRFNASSSFISLYPDGLNRTSNDLRDWLESDQERLPKGSYGVDTWIDNSATVSRVKELYPTTAESRIDIEHRRKVFLSSMVLIKEEMVLGADKNIYVEPVLWAIKKAHEVYGHPYR